MVIAQRRRPCACGVENIAKNTPSQRNNYENLLTRKRRRKPCACKAINAQQICPSTLGECDELCGICQNP